MPFPPKGYRAEEYPLPHTNNQEFNLSMEGTTKDSTIITLFRATEACIGAEAIEVNPRHASFGKENGKDCFMGSIVPKFHLDMRMWLTKVAIATDAVKHLSLEWYPIYISFLDTLTASDEKTAEDTEDILEFQHDTGNKDTFPLYSTVDLTATNEAMNTKGYTEVFGDIGLGTNLVMESVAFNEGTLRNALMYYTNKGMLRKVIGRKHVVHLTPERAYHFQSHNFTFPTVKRMNPYTYCGILFNVSQVGQGKQYALASETTAIDHVAVSMYTAFDEWNPEFNQTST